MSENRYRLEESFFWAEVSYHDIIEAEPQDDGSVRFLRVVTPSELQTTTWVISQVWAESPSLRILLDKVVAAGGAWERFMVGWLLVHLPPAEHAILVSEIESLFDKFIAGDSP